METIYIKCQNLFSGKYKKKTSICHLLNLAKGVVNINHVRLENILSEIFFPYTESQSQSAIQLQDFPHNYPCLTQHAGKKNISRQHFEILFSNFSQGIGFDILCKPSPKP